MTVTTAKAVPTPSRRRTGPREGRAAWILALPFCLLFLVPSRSGRSSSRSS